MEIARQAKIRSCTRFAEPERTRQSRQHLGQAKSTVEPVLRVGQVTPRVLGLFDGMVAPADRLLGIGHHHAHPASTADYACRAPAFGHQHGISVSGVHAARKTRQPVAIDLGVSCQPPNVSVGRRVVGKAAYWPQHCVTGMLQGPVGLTATTNACLLGAPRPTLPPPRSPPK